MVTNGNRSALRTAAAVLPITALALSAASASAQVTWSGQVDLGARQLFGNRASAKFLEYRSIPGGFFLNGIDLKLDWGAPGYFLTFRAADVLEGDQSLRLRAGRWGRYELAIDFDKTPHLFTTTGRTLYLESSPGVYTLPDRVRSSLRTVLTTDINPAVSGVQPDLAALNGLIDGLSRPVDLSVSREKGTVRFRYSPDPAWDLRVQYSRENQRGLRPFGATFSFASTEQCEPIDYSTHEFRANLERSGAKWTVQAGYAGTFFRNDVGALMWDNPFREGPDVSGSAAKGRIDLYPNNAAHQGTVSGGLVLPLQGRWTTTLAYGVMTQNDDFLPFTVNKAITGVPTLPASSANGRFETLHFSSALSLRPVRNVRVGMRYRYYDRDNETPRLLFSDYVRTDERLSGVARGSMPYAYNRQDAGADVTWQLAHGLALKGGYAWEGWDREYRETHSTSDKTWHGALDISRQGWLFVRAAYRRSDREADAYDAHHVAELMFPQGEPGLGQLGELRKFDQADRNRNRAELIARVTPSDKLSISVSHSLTEDDYHRSAYGRLENSNRTSAVELAYSPAPAVTLFGDYARALDRVKMRSRQRAPTADTPVDDWESSARDPLNTYGGGVLGQLAGGKLDVNLSWHVSLAETQTRTSRKPESTLVTSAADYPLVNSDFYVLDTALQYNVAARTAIRLMYRFERYDQSDFGLDPMAPFMGNWDASSAGTTWLGATRPDFRAHLLAVGLVLRM